MQPSTTFLSILGEAIQALGVLSITLLFLMLYRVLRGAYFLRWGQAWLAMLLALASLHLVFAFPSLSFLEPVYFAGEYLFSLLLWLGFVNFPRRDSRPKRFLPLLVLVIVCWSLFLCVYSTSFYNRFTLHSFAFVVSMVPAWYTLYKLRLPSDYGWVKKAALTSLSLLMLNFVLGGSALFSADFVGELVHTCYYAYQSIFDLMFEVLLAFSLLIIAAVNMKGELERANSALQSERANLVMLAHQDALTGCYNRHALAELPIRGRSGLVVMLDINNLKPINDNFGHSIGDEAICRVAKTVKAHMRMQDYLFRYGGDEFLIVSFDLQQEDAQQRMETIQDALSIPQGGKLKTVAVSWGISRFTDDHDLETAIQAADASMYQQKLSSRSAL